MSLPAAIPTPEPPIDERPSTSIRQQDWYALLALALLFGVMLAATWQRWTHPIIDHGREMNLPLRLLNGERLYIDIIFYYGPFAPYFNALLFKVFGVHLNVLHAAGFACAVAILLMIYWMARRILAPWEAGLATALVLITCATAGFLGNYIQPYSYSALYGWMFALASLVCVIRYVTTRRDSSMCWAGVWVGATMTCKPELGMLGMAPFGVAWLLASISERRLLWRPLLLGALPALAIALITYVPIVMWVPWQLLITDTVEAFTQPQMVYFATIMNGTRAWPFTGWGIVVGAGMALASCGLAALLGLILGQGLPSLVQRQAWRVWICLAAGAGLWVLPNVPPQLDVSPLRSALPVLGAMIVILGWRLWRALSRREPLSARDQIVFLIAIFSLIAIARVVLNLSLWSPYTPFTAATVFLIYCYLFFRVAPEMLVADPRARDYTRVIAMVLIGVWTLSLAVEHRDSTRFSTFEINAARGRLWTDPGIGKPLAEAIEFAAAHTKPGEYVLNLPQGSIVNFMADRPNPLREEIIVPGFLTPAREADAIRRVEAKGVKLILVSNHLTPEYRDWAFGLNYNQTFMQWIEQHYHPVATFRSQEGPEPIFGNFEFFIRAYERNVN